MASLNKVLLMGNLTRNPEIRYTPGGSAVCEFGMAMNRRFVQANGQEKDETCFVDITVWGKQAESSSRYLQKGSSVFVEGRLVYDQWVEKDTGNKRSRLRIYAERVQFLDRREASQSGGGEGSNAGNPAPSGAYSRFHAPQSGSGSFGGATQPPPNKAPDAPAMPEGPAYEPVEGIDDDIPF